VEKEGVTVEFEAQIDGEGKIAVPARLRDHLPPGETFHVRLTGHPLSANLRKRNIQDSEIRRISDLQLESREQVIRFLLSEGALKNWQGLRRAKAKRRSL
jgi:hypothetical protein